MTYNVKYTDQSKTPIQISERETNLETDITLFGRLKLEYGEDMNAALLHILENFACDEDPADPGNPDLTETSKLARTNKALLSTPIQGQMWWNKTQETMFIWDGLAWHPMSMKGDIGVNWGTICNGEQIPRPQSASGYIFDYDECVWIVSPKETDQPFDYALCHTDNMANVTMIYGNPGGTTRNGYASFMIVGIKGNFNLGSLITITPPVSLSPTPTPTPTPTTSGPPVSPTPTPTSSLPDITQTVTPTLTPNASITPTPTVTPTPSGEIQSGDLIPFGDLYYDQFNNIGFVSTGMVFNGYTSEFNPLSDDVRYGYRLETGAFDSIEGFTIDMGATIGNEPASWASEYWIYFANGINPSASVVEAVDCAPRDTWINLGTGKVKYVVDILTNEPPDPPPYSRNYNLVVYMQKSPTMPSGLLGATQMGRLFVSITSSSET